jgi:hypothetical protein
MTPPADGDHRDDPDCLRHGHNQRDASLKEKGAYKHMRWLP